MRYYVCRVVAIFIPILWVGGPWVYGCLGLGGHSYYYMATTEKSSASSINQPNFVIIDNFSLHKITHYRIDGVVIKAGSKCDFLLMDEDTRIAYLIELKGSDLKKAAIQLETTEEVLKNELATYERKFRIVVSKACTHAIESSTFKRFKKKKGDSLLYGTNKIVESI